MQGTRGRSSDSEQLQSLIDRHHRESLKRDLIHMARGDQHTPLLTARRRAASSMTDLPSLAAGSSYPDAITSLDSD